MKIFDRIQKAIKKKIDFGHAKRNKINIQTLTAAKEELEGRLKDMKTYSLSIFDITDIRQKKLLEELPILAEDKMQAQDKAHTIAYNLYPKVKRMISIREM